MIVIGTVVSKDVLYSSTIYEFRVEKIFKGEVKNSLIRVLTFSGYRTSIAGPQPFESNGIYLLLLRQKLGWKPGRQWERLFDSASAYYASSFVPKSEGNEFDLSMEALTTLLRVDVMVDSTSRTTEFLKLLRSTNYLVLESAIVELDRARVLEALPDLERLALAGGTMVQFVALNALRNMEGKREYRIYINALNSSDWMVRQRAIQNIIWTESFQAADNLIRIVADARENKDNRSIAANGLLRFHCVKSIPALKKILNEEAGDGQFRDNIRKTLDSLDIYRVSQEH